MTITKRSRIYFIEIFSLMNEGKFSLCCGYFYPQGIIQNKDVYFISFISQKSKNINGNKLLVFVGGKFTPKGEQTLVFM